MNEIRGLRAEPEALQQRHFPLSRDVTKMFPYIIPKCIQEQIDKQNKCYRALASWLNDCKEQLSSDNGDHLSTFLGLWADDSSVALTESYMSHDSSFFNCNSPDFAGWLEAGDMAPRPRPCRSAAKAAQSKIAAQLNMKLKSKLRRPSSYISPREQRKSKLQQKKNLKLVKLSRPSCKRNLLDEILDDTDRLAVCKTRKGLCTLEAAGPKCVVNDENTVAVLNISVGNGCISRGTIPSPHKVIELDNICEAKGRSEDKRNFRGISPEGTAHVASVNSSNGSLDLPSSGTLQRVARDEAAGFCDKFNPNSFSGLSLFLNITDNSASSSIGCFSGEEDIFSKQNLFRLAENVKTQEVFGAKAPGYNSESTETMCNLANLETSEDEAYRKNHASFSQLAAVDSNSPVLEGRVKHSHRVSHSRSVEIYKPNNTIGVPSTEISPVLRSCLANLADLRGGNFQVESTQTPVLPRSSKVKCIFPLQELDGDCNYELCHVPQICAFDKTEESVAPSKGDVEKPMKTYISRLDVTLKSESTDFAREMHPVSSTPIFETHTKSKRRFVSTPLKQEGEDKLRKKIWSDLTKVVVPLVQEGHRVKPAQLGTRNELLQKDKMEEACRKKQQMIANKKMEMKRRNEEKMKRVAAKRAVLEHEEFERRWQRLAATTHPSQDPSCSPPLRRPVVREASPCGSC